jgi:integrase
VLSGAGDHHRKRESQHCVSSPRPWRSGRRPSAEYVAKHKCPEVTPHIARHTFASLLASAGVSIYKIAQWLGDDVRVVQQHYAKLLPKDADIEAAF